MKGEVEAKTGRALIHDNDDKVSPNVYPIVLPVSGLCAS